MADELDRAPLTRSNQIRVGFGLAFGAMLIALFWLDRSWPWVGPFFQAIAHLFYEKSSLASLREPSQIALFRIHLGILGGLACAGLFISPWLSRHGRRLCLVLLVGYAIRAALWIAGSNLPLVPGDSCHYVEVASSIYRGDGPVKHYVESFFTDYSEQMRRRDGGVLDDWATPLFAYILATVYRVFGVIPGDSLEATFAVAKGTSFVLNLLTFPVLYVFARRRFGPSIALSATAILAVLPVHALYAGFELRESLVALTSLIAVWMLTETWSVEGAARWVWAIGSGVSLGLAILSRNTAMAVAVGAGLYWPVARRKGQFGPMIAWGVTTILVLVPWGATTMIEYGTPFHSYTSYFQYNFSWAVHHYDKGNTSASQFYTWPNAPSILRVKIKSLLIVIIYSSMIFSLPLMLGFLHRLKTQKNDVDRLVAAIAVVFAGATLAQIADVTQVAQLGRYYLPLFVIALPSATAGLLEWVNSKASAPARPLLAASMLVLLWADPTWAYDFTWLRNSYQLHWPVLWEAGRWVQVHPNDVPPNARIMTWFPWEFRLASRRTTILMNRSLYPPHLERTIRQYDVTHVLWGSFEPPPDVDAELWTAAFLTRTKRSLGLLPDRELFTSSSPSPFNFPVSLYRVGGRAP